MAYFSETGYGADGVYVSGNLVAARTGGGVFSWQNDQEDAVIVDSILVDVTVAATSSVAVLDIGQTATSAITKSDNMIDGADISTTARVYNHLKDEGTHGKGSVRVAKGKWITASESATSGGDVTGLTGKYYIHYRKVRP